MDKDKQLVERVLNILVLDRNNRPIPGAIVTIIINGIAIVSGVTKAGVGEPLTLQTQSDVESVTLRVTYQDGQTIVDKEFTVDLSERNFKARLPEVEMPNSGANVPSWLPIAGYIAGLVTLLFFMYVALFQPGPATFAHIFVGAFGCAMAAAFLGGDASAKGHLPIPFLNNHPLATSATGGIAVFIIVLVLGYTLFIRPQNGKTNGNGGSARGGHQESEDGATAQTPPPSPAASSQATSVEQPGQPTCEAKWSPPTIAAGGWFNLVLKLNNTTDGPIGVSSISSAAYTETGDFDARNDYSKTHDPGDWITENEVVPPRKSLSILNMRARYPEDPTAWGCGRSRLKFIFHTSAGDVVCETHRHAICPPTKGSL